MWKGVVEIHIPMNYQTSGKTSVGSLIKGWGVFQSGWHNGFRTNLEVLCLIPGSHYTFSLEILMFVDSNIYLQYLTWPGYMLARDSSSGLGNNCSYTHQFVTQYITYLNIWGVEGMTMYSSK